MTGRTLAIAALLFALALAPALPARAQTIPEGQSCGGLFCDMGIVGHKTAPAPAVAPPAEKPVAAALPAAASPVAAKRARPAKHVAAAPGRHPAPRPAAAPHPVVAAVPSASAPVLHSTPRPAAPAPTRGAPPAAGQLIPLPTAPAVAVQMPTPKMFYFQSVDPTLQ